MNRFGRDFFKVVEFNAGGDDRNPIEWPVQKKTGGGKKNRFVSFVHRTTFWGSAFAELTKYITTIFALHKLYRNLREQSVLSKASSADTATAERFAPCMLFEDQRPKVSLRHPGVALGC